MSILLTNSNSYQREKYTVPAHTVYTIDFNSNTPNYYVVNNMGDGAIYCSTNSIPKMDLYDFKVNAKSQNHFAEPRTRNKLYILNPYTEDIEIIIKSWEGEFDPSFLALSEITIDTATEIKTDGIIKGFTTPLPAGTNKIGSVDVDSPITSVLGGNVNNIRQYAQGTVTELRNILAKLVPMEEELNEIAWGSINNYLYGLVQAENSQALYYEQAEDKNTLWIELPKTILRINELKVTMPEGGYVRLFINKYIPNNTNSFSTDENIPIINNHYENELNLSEILKDYKCDFQAKYYIEVAPTSGKSKVFLSVSHSDGLGI